MTTAVAKRERASDPTGDFLRGLNDRTRYTVYRNVPIFTVHTRDVPATEATATAPAKPGYTVKVGKKELEAVCANAARLEADDGVVVRITLGHMIRDKNAPERDQPRIIGYARELKVKPFGRKQRPVITATFYVKKGCEPELAEYPYRSAEFYDDREEITGVALLKRDPELDLGMLDYYRADGHYHGAVVFRARGGDGASLMYQREVQTMPATMTPETDTPPVPDDEAAADENAAAGDEEAAAGDHEEAAADEQPEESPEEAEHYARFCGHVEKHPLMKYLHDQLAEDPHYQQYLADMGGEAPGPAMGGDAPPPAAAGATPGPTNTYIPDDLGKKKREDEAMTQNARAADPQQYARMQKELKAERTEAVKARLTLLKAEGYEFDFDAEVAKQVGMTPEARTARCAEVKQYHRRAPLGYGPVVDVAGGAQTSGPSQSSPEELRRIQMYAEKHGIRDGDEATKRYRASLG